MIAGFGTNRDLPNHAPGLDGLRGIAVLVVVTSHLHWITSTDPHFTQVTPWNWVNQALTRGFLGVDLFFVLSGFLITSLLLKTPATWNGTGLVRFYARRALRLLPALLSLLLASALVAWWEAFPMDFQWTSTRRALLFISNWDFRSVFLRTQDDLGHLWSLAIEKQFYVMWPTVLLLARTIRLRQRHMMALLSIAIAWVFFHRLGLWNSGENWIFIYPRTGARLDAILVGCLTAFIYRRFTPPRLVSVVLASLAALSLVLIAYFKADVENAFLYKGGFTVIAILCGVVVFTVAGNDPTARNVLHSTWLTWFGKVSYGLYLWHHLIFRVFARQITTGPPFVRITTAILCAVAIAYLSWQFIESPCLRFRERQRSLRQSVSAVSRAG